MGLASKMAAAQAAQGGAGGGGGGQPQQQQYGAPPPQQQQQQSYGAPPPPPGNRPGQPPQQSSQYGAPPPSQGQSQQYGAPPGAPPGQQPQGQSQYGQPPQGQNQYGAPPGPPPGQYGQQPQQGQQGQQQQYGAPPPQQGGQQYGQPPQGQGYGAPPPQQGQQQQQQRTGAPMDPRQVESILTQCVQDQNLSAFYPPGSLGPIAQKVAQSGALDTIASTWNMPKELATDLLKLALFDVVILVDDSGSMAFEEGGERIDDLKLILSRVAFVAGLLDADGIQVRFLNSNVEGNNLTNEGSVLQLLSQIKYSGLTPLGTSMDKKIIQPLLLGPARAGRLQKPMLIIAITDGTPAGEARDHIFRVITNANNELQRTRYGPDAVSYQFAQVGNDLKAQQFLGEIDTHPQIGGLVDVTSNYESEQAEMMQKSGMDLTPELWLVKLLMGGIDSSYDEQDEVRR